MFVRQPNGIYTLEKLGISMTLRKTEDGPVLSVKIADKPDVFIRIDEESKKYSVLSNLDSMEKILVISTVSAFDKEIKDACQKIKLAVIN